MTGDQRAVLTGAEINNLPDTAFGYIEPGGTKDAGGRTMPRSKRHFPIHDAPHVRAALARAPQSPFGKQAMPKILAAAKKFGVDTSGMQMNSQPAAAGEAYRSVPFQLERAAGGDGLTLEGYAAVFNSPTRIDSWEGRFDEVIAPGAFARTLADRTPVLMFEHGKHPLIGSMPLGRIERATEDSQGLHIQARLSDNWLIQPVRDAVRDGAVTGMSFRFNVPDGGDRWQKRSGQPDLRTITEANVAELGPVVFPAYEPTTATVRSLVQRLPEVAVDALAASEASSSGLRAVSGADTAALNALLTRLAAADAAFDPVVQAICAADCALDDALATVSAALGVPNPDPMDDPQASGSMSGPPRSAGTPQTFTGRPAARSAGGGDEGRQPPSGATAHPEIRARQIADDEALRLRGIK